MNPASSGNSQRCAPARPIDRTRLGGLELDALHRSLAGAEGQREGRGVPIQKHESPIPRSRRKRPDLDVLLTSNMFCSLPEGVGLSRRLAENFTISIVDDDPTVRDALCRLMDSAGLSAEAFARAEEFLASPSQAKTTCLILDVRMPGMDGLELQRRLVASGWKVPIIFISAHADEQVRAEAMQAGAVEFFEKPFSSPALLKTIRAARAPLGAGPPGK